MIGNPANRSGSRNRPVIIPQASRAEESEPAEKWTGEPMKVKSSIKRRTLDCQIVRRRGKLYIINKKNPRMKQRQG